jgi:NADH dehydrogenase
MTEQLHVVTGAAGYSGRFIARRLLDAGHRVRGLTGHLDRPDPFEGRVEYHLFNFDRPDELRRSLEGASAIYNTYWIRFDRGGRTHSLAVRNTKTLFNCAVEAGVDRFVHISITNPSADSHMSYFRGKAELEHFLAAAGISHAIIRPTVFFGDGDVLLNNLTWVLRRFPFFALAGRGDYRVQPVHPDDLARLAVEQGQLREDVTLDAAGPEVFAFEELVRLLAHSAGRKARVIHVPRWVMIACAAMVGWIARDVTLTADDVDCLLEELLVSADPPTGRIALSEWLAEHGHGLGLTYANELNRHYR